MDKILLHGSSFFCTKQNVGLVENAIITADIEQFENPNYREEQMKVVFEWNGEEIEGYSFYLNSREIDILMEMHPDKVEKINYILPYTRIYP